MFWWIFIGICAFLFIAGIVITVCVWHYDRYEWIANISITVAALFGFGFLLTTIIAPIQKVCLDQQVEVFKQQKYYIEEVVPTLPDTDNFALTQKRIELNEWLYKAKYEVEHFRFFTLYSDEVLELEEIK